jgi:hypothetical protein
MTIKSMSRNDQVQEILRCGKDPIYFIRTYSKIRHPVKGTIPFTTFSYQNDCINAFDKHRFNVILKARQLGLSTVCAAYAVWYSIFYKDKTILVIATKLATAMNFIKKVKVILESLPKWLLLTRYEDNKQSVTFANGSSITSIPTSPDAGRSEALSLLIVDEAAWIKNFEEIWTGLFPTISTGGRAIVLSTPNGAGGLYYKLCTEAEAGVNEFNSIRLPWYVHPEHDEEWFANETRGMSKRYIAQEYLCDFVSSGETYLTDDILEHLRGQIVPPTERDEHERNLWIWRRPIVGRRYVISADVSRGDSNDYSAFHVIDADSLEIVAEYMGKIAPDKLADLLMDVGKQYNTALLAPENNTFGYFTCVRLRDMGYKRLYYMSTHGDPFQYIPTDMNALPGFQTNSKTRTQILAKLEEVFRNKAMKIYSQRLYDQLQAFVWNGQRAEAMKGGHDDLVLSLAIGTWLVAHDVGYGCQATALAQAIIKSTSLERTDTTIVPNNPNVVRPVAGFMGTQGPMRPRDAYSPRDPQSVKHVDVTDFSWLMR